mmetsp:Transcript_9497/g.12331  ORF Transcript_9497/g.12331 Transcript_9497/m.12331 type:complete len:329 (+) Transcript_9497:763-1749(+)
MGHKVVQDGVHYGIGHGVLLGTSKYHAPAVREPLHRLKPDHRLTRLLHAGLHRDGHGREGGQVQRVDGGVCQGGVVVLAPLRWGDEVEHHIREGRREELDEAPSPLCIPVVAEPGAHVLRRPHELVDPRGHPGVAQGLPHEPELQGVYLAAALERLVALVHLGEFLVGLKQIRRVGAVGSLEETRVLADEGRALERCPQDLVRVPAKRVRAFGPGNQGPRLRAENSRSAPGTIDMKPDLLVGGQSMLGVMGLQHVRQLLQWIKGAEHGGPCSGPDEERPFPLSDGGFQGLCQRGGVHVARLARGHGDEVVGSETEEGARFLVRVVRLG